MSTKLQRNGEVQLLRVGGDRSQRGETDGTVGVGRRGQGEVEGGRSSSSFNYIRTDDHL